MITEKNPQDGANVLIIDGSMFEHSRSPKVKLLTKVSDYGKHSYKFGFHMLTLGWLHECTSNIIKAETSSYITIER